MSVHCTISLKFLKTIHTFSKTMRAIRIEKFGKESVLKLQDVEMPVVGDMILVKLSAAGVNPVDTYIREGMFAKLPELPFTPGKDGAGVIKEVGPNITNFKAGDRVFVCGQKLGKYGTYAEYCLAPEENVFSLNERLSFDEGAALGIPYFTAYRALKIRYKAKEGDTVLVHGASGAVGLACIQIAKSMNLNVIGTAGTTDGMELVKKAGACEVLCHREKKYTEKIMEWTDNKGVNLVVEMLANVNLDKDLDLLAPGGQVLVVGSRGPIKIDPRSMMMPETSIGGVALFSSTKEEWAEISNGILRGIDEGWIHPFVDKKYDLSAACDAHRDIIHSKGAKGKLILTM